MTDIEALMWRLGAHDPKLRPTMSLVVAFDGAVDRALLRARIERLAHRVPALRRRVDAGLLGAVPPRWEPDPDFSLSHHLQVARPAGPARVPGGGAGPGAAPPDAWTVATDVLSAPFPPGRPPWRVVLVPGPPDALVLHLHHSYTDGLGGVTLLGELFDLGGDPSAGVPGATDAGPGRGYGPGPDPAPESESAGRPTGPLDGLQQDLQAQMGRTLRLAGRVVPWAARSVRAASQRPDLVLRNAGDLMGTLRTHLAAATGPGSPVLQPRSAGVRLAAVDLPLESLRGAGRRLGATVNDVYLGGLLEGLARYHEKCAVLPPSLRLAVPISARNPNGDEPGMHNHLHGALMRGPLGPLDFDERTRLVHEMMDHARRQPWLPWVEDAAGVATRLPGAVGVVAAALGSVDVVASNVTGPPVPLQLGGVVVGSMVPVGPRSGSAVNATLLSYRDRAWVGLNIDPVSVGEPDVLVDCIRSAFADHLPESD